MLKIDPKFQNLIPPLSQDELDGLAQSILAHGRPRDALVVWKGILIDGHNRYAICQKYGLPFSTKEARFASKKEAELWIIQNQLGRRNITNAMRLELAHRKAVLQMPRGGIRKAIAKETGKSEQTVHKFMKIKKLADPDLLAKVLNDEIKINTAYAQVNEALEMTVTTVEKLGVDEKSVRETSILLRPGIINASINRIENLYDFLMGVNSAPQDCIAPMCKRLKAHNPC